MILSVSRRTDIPAFYSEWFMERLKQGYVYVKNPFNAKQISKVNIKPDVVDCIVFWTRNPAPLIDRLDEIDSRGYHYYFQFTITPYHSDVEKNNPDKKEVVETFKMLSRKVGKEKVILRYDPILISARYSIDFHQRAFAALCEKLQGYTEKVIISFLDDYRKVSRNMKGFDLQELNSKNMYTITKMLVKVASRYNLPIETCAEAIDLEELGVNRAKCIDGELIERIIGYTITNKDKRDDNRQFCGCMKCIDIGQYDTCIHNCLYCYANVNKEKAMSNYLSHTHNSPMLIGDYDESLIKERKGKDVNSFRIAVEKCDDEMEQGIIRYRSFE